jgi:hypothetical protein
MTIFARSRKENSPPTFTYRRGSFAADERNTFRNAIMIGRLRRALMALAVVGAGALTLGATSAPARAYAYPY